MNTTGILPDNVKMKKQRTVKQLLEEIHSWKRLLDFLSEENNHLKLRLARAGRMSAGRTIAEENEWLIPDIHKTDQIISLNRSAILHYEKWLSGQHISPEKEIEYILKRHLEYRKQMNRVGSNFAIQQIAFNDHLSKNL